jgi:hypothetical protein
MSHWVEAEAKRANRNLLVTNAVILATTIAAFALNRDIDYKENIVPVLIGVGILLLAGWNCVRAIRRSNEIQTTPIWRQVAIFGDVEQLAAQIEQDQLMGKTKFRNLVLTPGWVIRKSFFSTWVSPLADLAWAYKKVTKHYTNFIPTGKTYAAIIIGRHRQRIEVQLSQKKTDELLRVLAERVPWAIYGHSKEIADAWQKDANGFVAAVDSRQREVKSKAAAVSSST